MAKYGIVREISVNPAHLELEGATPIVPLRGVFLRFRAIQASDEVPDIEGRPLRKGEGLLLVSLEQAEELSRLLAKAVEVLEN